MADIYQSTYLPLQLSTVACIPFGQNKEDIYFKQHHISGLGLKDFSIITTVSTKNGQICYAKILTMKKKCVCSKYSLITCPYCAFITLTYFRDNFIALFLPLFWSSLLCIQLDELAVPA